MLSASLLLILGLVVLGIGAELLVGGACRLSQRLGIPPLIVGLTVVAFGTSAPELAVSVGSAVSGYGSLALGNVIGSNIANIGLILGITAFIFPIPMELKLVNQQIPILITTAVILAVLLLDGELSLLDGGFLSLGLTAYLILNYVQAKREPEVAEVNVDLAPLVVEQPAGNPLAHIGLILVGLALLILGSQVFVTNAVELARLIGISEAVIGLSLVAIGTSVPELATAALAAIRKQPDIAVGNVIGSNIFNVLCVLGTTAWVSPIASDQLSIVDFIVMFAFSLILLPFARSGFTISRKEGAILLVAYVAYIGYLAIQA